MATYEDMREKVRNDSNLSLSFFVFLLIIFTFHAEYIDLAQQLTKTPNDLAAVLEKSWLALVLPFVAPFVAYFLGIITISNRDLYYSIDNTIIRRRIRVDTYICMTMLNLKAGLSSVDIKNLEALKQLIGQAAIRKKVMSLFYLYIEKPELVNPELKSQAFVYWGDYFSSLMFIFWGVLALAFCLVILLVDKSVTLLRLLIFLVMIVFVLINLRQILGGKTEKHQYEIPETQITEIHRQATTQLLADLKAEGFFLTDGQHSRVS